MGRKKAIAASSLSCRKLATSVLFPALDLQRKDYENPVCRQGNSLTASPGEEGALGGFTPYSHSENVPAAPSRTRPKSSPGQRPAGQTGLLHQNQFLFSHTNLSVLSVNFPHRAGARLGLRCCRGHFLGLQGLSSSLLSLLSTVPNLLLQLLCLQANSQSCHGVESRGHKRFSKRRWESGGQQGQPCSCLRPQASAAQANCRLRGPIPQSTPEQEGPAHTGLISRRHTETRKMQRCDLSPHNAPVQPQKPQNQPQPHSQINTNMQSRKILQKGKIQTRTKTRHPVTECPALTQSLSHSDTGTRQDSHSHHEAALQGHAVRETISNIHRGTPGGPPSQHQAGTVPSRQATVTHRLTYTARHTGKGPRPATGPQISEPASPTVTS